MSRIAAKPPIRWVNASTATLTSIDHQYSLRLARPRIVNAFATNADIA
ncbi:hypothetical protein K0817_017745 [Microbacterium sp. HD4P20]|nr:hypothetical protein [Microbacterium sp. HD4P20]MCP2638399.1 hypothetical protein [Microbacterium sp. HD4P20]